MKYTKLNIGWDAEPNAPMPSVQIEKDTNKVRLYFCLNAFIHDDANEDDIGILEFTDCYKYRLGVTNDEGFYRGHCRFSKSGIQWGDFYELEDSGWEVDFPNDEVIVDAGIENSNDLKHYLFYFRDSTFECIAKSHCLEVQPQLD